MQTRTRFVRYLGSATRSVSTETRDPWKRALDTESIGLYGNDAQAHTHHHVDVDPLYHTGHGLPFEVRVERRSLERVAGVQEQTGGARGPRLGASPAHGRPDPRETAVTRSGGRGARRTGPIRLVEARVHVVGVQHQQPVNAGVGRGRGQQQQRQQQRQRQPQRAAAAVHRARESRTVTRTCRQAVGVWLCACVSQGRVRCVRSVVVTDRVCARRRAGRVPRGSAGFLRSRAPHSAARGSRVPLATSNTCSVCWYACRGGERVGRTAAAAFPFRYRFFSYVPSVRVFARRPTHFEGLGGPSNNTTVVQRGNYKTYAIAVFNVITK